MALSAAALTTVARMEAELSISGASATLEPLIEEASAELQAACGRNFYSASGVEEKVRGYGGAFMSVRDHLPLTSITSIVFDDGDTQTTIDSDDYEIEDAASGLIRHKGAGWQWTALEGGDITRDPRPGTEERLYVITYVGGYVTPEQGGTRTLPYDIERAVIDMVKALYWARGRDPGVRSKGVSRASVQYGMALSEIPNVARVLERYRFLEIA